MIEPRHFWAKAQYDWETDTSAADKVRCRQCDVDGSNERTTDIWVRLPKNAVQDPTVFQGDVIGFEVAHGNVAVCSTVYTDGSKIGDTRFVKSADNIRPGWRECDGQDGSWDMANRAAIGRDVAGGVDAGDAVGAVENAIDHVGGASHPDMEGDTGDADGHSHTIALDYTEVLADAPSRAGVWIERFK